MQKTIVTSDSNSTAMKNPWFNNEFKILKSELNKAARKFKTNNANEKYIEKYRLARKNYLCAIKSTKELFEKDVKAK
jgi:hypothetical protein